MAVLIVKVILSSALSLYWKNARLQSEDRRGEVKQHDKRSDLKEREWQLDKARIAKKYRPILSICDQLLSMEAGQYSLSFMP